MARSTEVATFPGQAARFGLEGRTVFISGAAGHLGRAMAIGCAQAGAHVILNGRTATTLEAFREELAAEGLSASVAAFRNDSGKRTYIITTRRMISDHELKRLHGLSGMGLSRRSRGG